MSDMAPGSQMAEQAQPPPPSCQQEVSIFSVRQAGLWGQGEAAVTAATVTRCRGPRGRALGLRRRQCVRWGGGAARGQGETKAGGGATKCVSETGFVNSHS